MLQLVQMYIALLYIIVFVELRSYYYIFLQFFKDFNILVTIISETFNL